MAINVDDNGVVQGMEKLRIKARQYIAVGLDLSAKVVQGYARSNHNFKASTSRLEDAIDYEVYDKQQYAEVFINEDIAPYGKYVHEPTGKYGPKKKPYDIFPKNKKMLRFAPSPGTAKWRPPPYGRFFKEGWCFAFGVSHPGSPADPFLYNALENTHDEVIQILNQHVQKALEAGK